MNIFEKIIGNIDAKKEFRAYRKRAEALPKEYNVVFDEIQSYVWSFGALDGSLDMLSDILTLFETGAAEGKRVLEITGNDVTRFCDNIIIEWKSHTWQEQIREKYNKRIHKKLDGLQHKHH
jgi:DNA-binding ferritin-like protein (Dps family)